MGAALGRLAAPFVLLGAVAGGASIAGAEEVVTIALAAPSDPIYVGERITLGLRIEIDAEFLADRAIQPFRQELGTPVAVRSPWAGGIPGLRPLQSAATGGTTTIALDDDVVSATEIESVTRAGRTFRVLLLERAFAALRAGAIELAAPEVGYAHATRFEEDFVVGRVPADRVDGRASGTPTALAIHSLPTAGRPADFGGAVGSFRLHAEATPTELSVGDVVRVRVTITGSGDLGGFDPPLVKAPGLHVVGVIDDRNADPRVVTYEIEVLSPDVRAIPAVSLATFTPVGAGSYGHVGTQPIPLAVEAGEGGTAPGADSAQASAEPGASEWIDFAFYVLPLIALIVWMAWRLRRERRRGAAPTPAQEFHARAADHDLDLATLLAAYLAERLDCPAAAVISPDLPDRLMRKAVPQDVAARTSAVIEQLVAARYGGRPPDDAARTEATEVVTALERTFSGAFERSP